MRLLPASVISTIKNPEIHRLIPQSNGAKATQQFAVGKEYHAQQAEIKKLEQFIAKNGAGVNASIAKGRKKQLDKIERVQLHKTDAVTEFDFSYAPIGHQSVVSAEALSIGYQTPLLSPIDITVARGEKLVIEGFNGVGKSTLLKTLMGRCFHSLVK